MATEKAERQLPSVEHAGQNVGTWMRVAGGALLLYLSWLILRPFLSALCWAFGLALVAQPFHRWLCRRISRRNLSAAITEVAIALVLVAPTMFFIRVLIIETSEVAMQLTSDDRRENLRSEIKNNQQVRTVVDWLESRAAVRQEVTLAVRKLASWISSLASSALTASIWFVTQIIIMVYVLFYFIRDGPLILGTIASVLPLPHSDTQRIFARIGETIRMSLYGKLLVASIQGSLGGLMFWWVGLPVPVLWGFLMVLVSAFPLLGTFVVWCPAAIMLALQGQWTRAIVVTVWGLAVIHPVDNFLGPIFVGTALRLHTLLMFFAVIGGVVAFGPSGFVLGPVIVAVAVTLFEIQQNRTTLEGPANLPLETAPPKTEMYQMGHHNLKSS